MNSLTVLAGTLLLTTITASVENDTATGAKSRIRSYGLLWLRTSRLMWGEATTRIV